VDRAADVLHRGVACDGGLAGLLVHLHVRDVHAEAGAGALRVHRHLGRHRPAGARRLQRDLGEAQRLERAGVDLSSFDPLRLEAVDPRHVTVTRKRLG
jgi:hypothetical protein